MKSTRFVEPFAKEVDYWEHSLSYIMEALEFALAVQRQWLYLEVYTVCFEITISNPHSCIYRIFSTVKTSANNFQKKVQTSTILPDDGNG